MDSATSGRTPEKKVLGATGGTTVGATLAGLIIWALDQWVYTGDRAVPAELSGALLVLIPIVLTFVGGYLTPHTVRTDPVALKAAVRAGAILPAPSLLDRDPGDPTGTARM